MSAKHPLVLLPGLLCDEELWRHQVRHLGDVADIRVGTLAGAGGVEGLAADVLASAPPVFSLAGHSMGGYVALELMRRAPERVSKLTLLATNAHADPPEAKERRRKAMAFVARGRFDDVVALMASTLVDPVHLADGAVVRNIREMAGRVGPDAYLRQQEAIMARPDSRPDLATIGCPTMVLCGRRDQLSGVDVHAGMAAAIPGARLAVIEDCGHMAPIEQPQAVTALMRVWLQYI
ncbi:alpha/beta fold hydrolase [Arenibaculum sp.]|uniref:alpha/beta fold hydrolase n=1 Tax=Arenibaculum sp. TaxID=2865862 RepID=UPI002E154402|nr:alpha/beta fold hydrolase [Arenibaculum sp.]